MRWRLRQRIGSADIATLWQRSYHVHRGADLSHRSEMQDVRVKHPGTSRRGCTSNRLRIIGAVDAIEGIAQIERHRPQRILDAARHLLGKAWVAFTHFRGGIPIRPRLLAAYCFSTCPVKTLAADGDPVFVSMITWKNVIEFATTGIDHDGV